MYIYFDDVHLPSTCHTAGIYGILLHARPFKAINVNINTISEGISCSHGVILHMNLNISVTGYKFAKWKYFKTYESMWIQRVN